MGGDKSRAVNAVTMAVTGALGGQTDVQATTNLLAPYVSQLIGKTFGQEQDKNTTAQLVSHAILGGVLAYVNGGDPIAGGSAAVAGEATATYLASRYNDGKTAINPKTGEFDPNLLPEDIKSSIRDLTSAIGAVVGGTIGDSAFNAQISGAIGKNVIENNTLHMVNADGTKSYELPPETQTFNRYEVLVGLGIIPIDQVPQSVYEDVAKLGLHGKKDEDVTAETFQKILAKQTDTSTGKYLVDTQDLLSSISESVGVKWLYADDTITQSHVTYKFAKYGLEGLSNSEIESLSTLMLQYANYRPSLGDSISVENVKNQGMIFALLQAGISEGKIKNGTSTDSNRQSALTDLYASYNRLFLSDANIQYDRDSITRLQTSSTSAIGTVTTGICDAAGGSRSSCTNAGVAGAAFEGALGAGFVGKVITPLKNAKSETTIPKVEPINKTPDVYSVHTGKTNISYTEKSIFNKYPTYTELKFNSLDEQAKFLSNSIEGLSIEQAKIILEAGASKNTSIVMGGSRVRGNNSSTSDIDIGFGSLNANQAWKAIQQIQKKSNQLDSSLKLEETRIIPGNSTKSIATIKSPEEFFQRNGIRGAKDEKAGQVYFGSGAISVFPDGRVIITPPNYKDK